ncbi:MAG: hypothetical protein ACQERC_09925 [Bacteroidota bacterium]
MVTQEYISQSPDKLVGSYLDGIRSDKSTNYLMKAAYGSRRQRRSATRSGSLKNLKENIDGFIKVSEKFLNASREFYKAVDYLAFNELEEVSELSKQAVASVDFRTKAIERLKRSVNYDGLDKALKLLSSLGEVNTKIHKQSEENISAHSKEGAFERGYILISSLHDIKYSMKYNLKIKLEVEDEPELCGSVSQLDITEYAEDFDDLLEGIKEYIIHLYEELVSSRDVLLSSDLIEQKKLLKTIIEKVK